MAGIKIRMRYRVSASSLLEVIVAMVIIVVVFGLAMMIAANVSRGSLSVEKLHAQAVLKNVLAEEEGRRDFVSRTISIDSVAVEQEVKPYDAGLVEIHLTAYDNSNKKMAELRKVVISNDEETR